MTNSLRRSARGEGALYKFLGFDRGGGGLDDAGKHLRCLVRGESQGGERHHGVAEIGGYAPGCFAALRRNRFDRVDAVAQFHQHTFGGFASDPMDSAESLHVSMGQGGMKFPNR